MILGINEKWFKRREVVKAAFSVQCELPGDKRMLESLLPSNVTYARHKETTNRWHGGYSIYEVRGCEPIADTLARAKRKYESYREQVGLNISCLLMGRNFGELASVHILGALDELYQARVEKFKEETKGER